MIDPATNPKGETFQDYNQRRWGGSGWTHNLKKQGQQDDLGANFQNWKWWPNTLNAHRFIWYVCHNSNQNSLDTSTANEILFEAIYEQGDNVSLPETLVKIGTTHPLLAGKYSQKDLTSFLSSQDGIAQVQKEIQHGKRQYQISSVPFFIIEPAKASKEDSQLRRPYGISGAQQTQTFLNIFEELSNK